ncbi:hypothetical protein GF376_00930 [Candidatus Peregrinibacteria bacterium]|nr:hypothetical protein [Candidatus Peregrinibacteria bacterium]
MDGDLEKNRNFLVIDGKKATESTEEAEDLDYSEIYTIIEKIHSSLRPYKIAHYVDRELSKLIIEASGHAYHDLFHSVISQTELFEQYFGYLSKVDNRIKLRFTAVFFAYIHQQLTDSNQIEEKDKAKLESAELSRLADEIAEVFNFLMIASKNDTNSKYILKAFETLSKLQ